jgi:hypothetical protein
MKPTYDIFKELPGGGPIWIDSVPGLDEAIDRTKRIAKTCPGKYSVYDLTRTRAMFQISAPAARHADRLEFS